MRGFETHTYVAGCYVAVLVAKSLSLIIEDYGIQRIVVIVAISTKIA